MQIGDVFGVPLVRFDREARKFVDIGAFGACKVLANHENVWFVGGLETFATDPAELAVDAPLLTMIPVTELPRRKGHAFVRGETEPEEWITLGNSPISELEAEFVDLYNTWKHPTKPMFETQTAYEKLGGCSEGLDSIEGKLSLEWRVRFDLAAVLEERKPKQVEEKPTPSWEEVAAITVSFGVGVDDLNREVQTAYENLIAALTPKRNKTLAKKAIKTFYKSAFQSRQSSEYRDEIASIAAKVGMACGLREQDVYGLAE